MKVGTRCLFRTSFTFAFGVSRAREIYLVEEKVQRVHIAALGNADAVPR